MPTEVKFRLAGGAQPLILVPASVNGDGPHEFILDTGAGLSLLTPELAERLGVKATESKEGMGAGGKVTISLGVAESLSIGQARIESVQVGITDEVKRIGAAIGAKVDGDIGYDYLKNFRLTIDYEKQTLRLAQSEQESNGIGNSSSSARALVKFKLAHPAKPLILVPAMLNGEGPYIFAVDTGASTTVLSPEVAEMQGIKSIAIPSITGAGGTMRSYTGVTGSLALDRVELKNLTVVITDSLSMISQAIATRVDGIIGYNFLKEFKVTIDYTDETLRLD